MKILVFVFTLMSFSVMAQTSAENWKTLSGLEYEKTKDEYGEIFVPKFGPKRVILAHVIS